MLPFPAGGTDFMQRDAVQGCMNVSSPWLPLAQRWHTAICCLQRYQRWDAQFAGDLFKPLDHLFMEGDAVLPTLPFFLVF